MKFYAEIKEGFLYIDFDTESLELTTKIILDTLDNKDNIHESDEDLHTRVLELSDFTLVRNNSYKLDITDTDAFVIIITIENAHLLAYDDNNIYSNIVNMLTSFCDTCLDKVLKEKVFLCSMRKSLFDYSVSLNYDDNENPVWLNEVINNYIDLDRILNQENTNCYDTRFI